NSPAGTPVLLENCRSPGGPSLQWDRHPAGRLENVIPEGRFAMKQKKHTTMKPRNPLVPAMRLSRKPGAFVNRKKEASRKACRLYSSRFAGWGRFLSE
ncbi:MAG: hypothetical protein V1792_09355, partial [Pseudomonadota bacterium]